MISICETAIVDETYAVSCDNAQPANISILRLVFVNREKACVGTANVHRGKVEARKGGEFIH